MTVSLANGWMILVSGIAANHEPQEPSSLSATSLEVRVVGWEIAVPEIEPCADFYRALLGFTVAEPNKHGMQLRHGDLRLSLIRTSKTPPGGTEHLNAFSSKASEGVGCYPNVQVADLSQAAQTVRQAKGTVVSEEPQRFALGWSLRVRDPAGNPLNLLTLESRPMDADEPPRLFNFGVNGRTMDSAEALFVDLGFKVFSRDYLPTTLPLERRGVAAVVLHGLPRTEERGLSASALLMEVQEVDDIACFLKQQPENSSAPIIGSSPWRDPDSGIAIRFLPTTAPSDPTPETE